MKKFFIFFLLISSNIFGQSTIDFIKEQKTVELETIGIKNYFFYHAYCNGSIRLVDINEVDCAINGQLVYLFWQDDHKSYMQSLGVCNNKIEISNAILNYFLENKLKIADENVQPYQTDKNTFLKINHSCFKELNYKIDGKEVRILWNEFDISTKEDQPNINFQKNNNLNLIKLSKLCEIAIQASKL